MSSRITTIMAAAGLINGAYQASADSGSSSSSNTQVDKSSRMRGALWGPIVGDAVALGSHWIYDQETMEKEFPGGVKGFETPKEGHYHYGKKSGDSTHYGDGYRVMLESIAETGLFDERDFLRRFLHIFDENTYKGYLDTATRQVLKNLKDNKSPTGGNDNQAATATRINPVIVRYIHNQDLEGIVERATRAGQNNIEVLAFMRCHSQILSDLIKGVDLETAFKKHIKEELCGRHIDAGMGMAQKGLTPAQFASAVGLSCYIDKVFTGAVYVSMLHKDNFEKALLFNAQMGGDSTGRGALIGGWLGALHGVSSIPSHWKAHLTDSEMLDGWIERVVEDALENRL